MEKGSHLIEIAWPKNNGLPFHYSRPGKNGEINNS